MYGRAIPQAQEKGHLNPLEMEQLKYAIQVGETMKALKEYGNQVLPEPTDLALHPFQPGDWVNLNTWKTSSCKTNSLLRGTDPRR